MEGSDMQATNGPGLYPLHRCKTLHLVRHAQGAHNVAGEMDHNAYDSEEYFDAHLTPLGWQQVDNLRKHVHRCGLSKNIELVIVSPLLRTMQTAVGVFGGKEYADGIDATPLMVANVGNSDRSAISSLSSPPFLAVELCRERLNVHPCDRRRSINEYQDLFPAIDFSLIESNEDILWKPHNRETDEEVAARGMKFIDWNRAFVSWDDPNRNTNQFSWDSGSIMLWTRKEKEIAIVTHSGFLLQTLSAFGNDCHQSVKSEICRHFANCELRSVVVVDRSGMGSDPSPTNYPGKIPSGIDRPSDDVMDQKL